jgi:uncharacterized membrane protein
MGVSKHLKKKFITGVLVLTPLIITIYIVYLVISSFEAVAAPFIRGIMRKIAGKEIYIPGTGFVLFICIAYATGILASNYVGKRLLSYGEGILRRIPFVKGIYSSVKDMTDAFSSDKAKSFKEVVLAEFPFKGRYAIGFITKRTPMRNSPDLCSVFIPTTPNPTSGYLLMIYENELVFVNMPVDDALKYIISLGTSRIELEWNEKPSSNC